MKVTCYYLPVLIFILSSCSKDEDINTAPIASFIIKDEISKISLSSTATDAENDLLTYKWITDSDLIFISNANEKTAHFSIPDFDKDSEVTIKHIVLDNANSDTTSQVITVPAYTNIRKWGLGRELEKSRSNNNPYEWYLDQGNTGKYKNDNCGPTCVTMAIKWVKEDFDKDPEYARNIYHSSGGWWYTGDIINYLNTFSINKVTIELTNTDLIIDEIDKGRIIILCCDMYYIQKSTIPQYRIHKFYSTLTPDWGHFLIVKGYKIVDGNVWFEVYDPNSFNSRYADSSLKGKNRYYLDSDIDEATNIWWDYAIVVSHEMINDTQTVNTDRIEHKYGL